MAQIVDLNELVPDDITILYGNPPTEYPFPGDIEVDTVFRLFKMRQALAAIEGETPEEIVATMERKFGDIQGELLAIFQQRTPSLEKLPFGIRSLGAVLSVVLGQLGLTVVEENPTPPKPKTAAKTRSARARSK